MRQLPVSGGIFAVLFAAAVMFSGLAAAQNSPVSPAVGSGPVPGSSQAQQPEQMSSEPENSELEKKAQSISEATMSPFCPGRTLSSCPSDQARQLRGEIVSWLKQGYTAEAIRNRLLVTYGEEIRGTPQASGFGLMAWIAPAVFVLLSVAAVALKLRRMRSQGTDKRPVPLQDKETMARVSEELQRRQQQ